MLKRVPLLTAHALQRQKHVLEDVSPRTTNHQALKTRNHLARPRSLDLLPQSVKTSNHFQKDIEANPVLTAQLVLNILRSELFASSQSLLERRLK